MVFEVDNTTMSAWAVPSMAPVRKRSAPVHRGSGTRFSGAPLWRFTLRKDEQRRLQEVENLRHGVPNGFIRQSSDWYWDPQQRIFWQCSSQKFYLYDEASRTYSEFHRAVSIEGQLRLVADASCLNTNASVLDRHVIVKDLWKAAHALRMSIDHIARPCALFAVYTGHRPLPEAEFCKSTVLTSSTGSNARASSLCAEFCARNLHLKLLTRLSEFKGVWDDSRTMETLKTCFEELDAEFLTKSVNAVDGCSAVFTLVMGQRIFIASLGDAVGLLHEEADFGHLMRELTSRHLPSEPHELQRIYATGGVVLGLRQEGRQVLRAKSGEILSVSRSFGDRAFKVRPDSENCFSGSPAVPLVIATPDVYTGILDRRHKGLILVCGAIRDALTNEDLAKVVQKCVGRPRVICSELVEMAHSNGGIGSLTALCVSLDWTAEQTAPPTKKMRSDTAVHGVQTQVRCRQILVKHKDSKEAVDRVRGNRQVTRTLVEAERVLRDALEAIEGTPEKSVFTQRCKAISECETCLKGGEMAGDLGWISRGKVHPAVEAAAFTLPVGHISDIVESDEGVHLLWRIA